jgi:hypothetical protein
MENKKCYHCLSEIPYQATHCSKCGRKLKSNDKLKILVTNEIFSDFEIFTRMKWAFVYIMILLSRITPYFFDTFKISDYGVTAEFGENVTKTKKTILHILALLVINLPIFIILITEHEIQIVLSIITICLYFFIAWKGGKIAYTNLFLLQGETKQISLIQAAVKYNKKQKVLNIVMSAIFVGFIILLYNTNVKAKDKHVEVVIERNIGASYANKPITWLFSNFDISPFEVINFYLFSLGVWTGDGGKLDGVLTIGILGQVIYVGR